MEYKQPSDKGKKKITLRIGQFNVLNLVRENEKFYDKEHYTKDQVERKVKWISEQLKKMNAGIVGFEEVFHDDVLKRCTDASGLYQNGEVVSFGANGSGPTVALVSAYPVVEKKSITDFPPESILNVEGHVIPLKKFSRPILRAVILLPTGHKITVFVAHLKSKRPIVSNEKRHDQKAKAVGHAMSLVMRAAESAAFRCILVEEMRNTAQPVVVLGDLNDVVHSVTTEIITGTQPWKMLPRNQKEDIWDTLLWSTNEVQVRSSDRDVTYSHIHNGRYEVLDHILVSQEFVRSNPAHIGYVQFLNLYNDHLVDETLSDDKRDLTQSDHGQIVACIKMFYKDQNNNQQQQQQQQSTGGGEHESHSEGHSEGHTHKEWRKKH